MDRIPKGKRLHFRDAFRLYVLDDPELQQLANDLSKVVSLDEGRTIRAIVDQAVYEGDCRWPVDYSAKTHIFRLFAWTGMIILDGNDSGLLDYSQTIDNEPFFERLEELVQGFFAKLANEELFAWGYHHFDLTNKRIPFSFWMPANEEKYVDVAFGSFLFGMGRLRGVGGLGPVTRFEGIKVGVGDTLPSPDSSDGHDSPGNVSISGAEKRCEKWLQALPIDPRKKKKDALIEAQNQFEGLSERAFVRAWDKKAPKSWRLQGRPKKQNTAPIKT